MRTNVQYATVIADPASPTLRIEREIDATVADVFRAHVEFDLVRRWLWPRGFDVELRAWDCVPGGSYRMAGRNGAELHGTFPEVVTNERIVQTFAATGTALGADLAVLTFADAGGGRCLLGTTTAHESVAVRDRMLRHDLGPQVITSYQRLENLVGR